MDYDVIIIGAGSMGMSAGYFLSKAGKRVLLLDSHTPPHTRGSHHGETRIIRYAYGEGEKYVPLALAAGKLWRELETETGKKLFFQTGVLNLGKEETDFIRNVKQSAVNFSLQLEIMRKQELERKWPGLTVPDGFIGCYEPSAGVLKPESCIEAYQALAELHGAVVLGDSRVEDIEATESGVKVCTKQQTFTSKSLIISAGAWTGHLTSMLDLNLPLQPVRKTFAWFNSDEEIYNHQKFPAFTVDSDAGTFYGFPSIEGKGLKIGRHDGGKAIEADDLLSGFGAEIGDHEDLEQFTYNYMLHPQYLREGKTCMYTLTPDDDFIVDVHPSCPNIAIAAGFSGHGFKFSSVIGQILSELIEKGNTEKNISPFSISRFK